MNKQKQSVGYKNGFTVVELMVVIVIIGILATISIISYGNFRKSIAVAQLKSDLSGVGTAMESTRTFSNAYPAVLPTIFTPTKDNNGNAVSTFSNPISFDGNKTYCIDGTSVYDNTIHYYIDSTSSTLGAQLGTCTLNHPAPSNLVATTISNTSISASWDAIAGATGYTLQRDITSAFTSPISIALTTNTSVATGLTQGINYYYRVNATTGVTGGWSDTASANTNIPAPSAPSVAVTFSGSNVLATIASVSCSVGSTPQYSVKNRTNDGSWSSYTTWGSAQTATQPSAEGVKYGYQAQARCYISDALFSSIVNGSEGTNIKPITTVPSIPNSYQSTPEWDTTYYTWDVVSCPASTWPLYSYYSWNDSGWNSGWLTTTTASASYSSAHFGYNYYLKAKAQCVSSYASGGLSGEGSTTSFYRGVPWVSILAVGGGGGGATSSVDGAGAGGGGGGVVQYGRNINNGNYNVVVGGGGQASYPSCSGPNGGNSYFQDGPTALGGGDGGWTHANGCSGASGGGGSGGNGNSGGSATQGNNGCSGQNHSYEQGGGGGGYGGGCNGMDGGAGFYSWLTGDTYAGGGGGGSHSTHGWGGSGGGGAGGQSGGGTAGTANTGGGGGGGGAGGWGQPGGTGIVVIRYNGHQMGAGCASTGYWIDSNDVVQKFFGSGTFCVWG